MEKVVAIEDMSRQGRNRAYALMLMMLVGAGVIGALAAVCEDSFAQAGAKGKGQDAVGKAAMTDCDPNWVVVNSPSPGQYNNRLNGVVALSSSDVGAVGSYNAASVIQTLLEH